MPGVLAAGCYERRCGRSGNCENSPISRCSPDDTGRWGQKGEKELYGRISAFWHCPSASRVPRAEATAQARETSGEVSPERHKELSLTPLSGVRVWRVQRNWLFNAAVAAQRNLLGLAGSRKTSALGWLAGTLLLSKKRMTVADRTRHSTRPKHFAPVSMLGSAQKKRSKETAVKA